MLQNKKTQILVINALTLQGVDPWAQQGKKLKPFSISKLVLLVFFQCKCLC